MENNENSINPNTGLPSQRFDQTSENRKLHEDIGNKPLDTDPLDTTSLDSIPLNTTHPADTTLPYEDPAVVNPEELASFPKPAPKADAADVENESENRLVNKRSPVRDGTHITRTGNEPNEEGYI